MVMPPFSAALNPYTMPLWICCSTPAGFTTWPQSTAQTTRCTLSLPFSTETSATCAVKLPMLLTTAMPRPRPAGSGLPHPAFSAASSSTASRRADSILPTALGGIRTDLCRRRRPARRGSFRRRTCSASSPPTPVAHRNSGIGRVIIHQEIGDGVGRIDDAFHAGARDAVAQAAKGRADDAAVNATGQPSASRPPRTRVGGGTIAILLHIVFARPGDLHRRAERFRDLDRFADVIGARAASESAAHILGVDLDLDRAADR